MDDISVGLREHTYNIVTRRGVLAEAGQRLKSSLPSTQVFVLTDSNVGPLYAGNLVQNLEAAGIRVLETAMIPAGEASKNFATVEMLASRFLKAGLDRKTAVIALGGGVVGDIAGFLAAILMRGVPFVQMPTTLMAMVDSSVGGKTGINTPEGKNMVGAFWQPKAVLIDTEFLATLPRRELLSGYAEVVKYGLIRDRGFFEWLEKNGVQALSGDASKLQYIIHESCKAKALIVGADEYETTGERALLNLGHSFGHALEAMAGYGGSLLHGEAVAIGMALAFRLSHHLGLCPAGDVHRVERHLAEAGLETGLPKGTDPRTMLGYMKRDKKAQGGQVRLVLAKGIGQAFQSESVDEKEVMKFLQAEQAEG